MWGSCLTLKFILFMMLALTRSYEVLGEYSGLGRTHFPSNCCQDHNHVLQISCCTWRWESSSCCKAAFKFYSTREFTLTSWSCAPLVLPSSSPWGGLGSCLRRISSEDLLHLLLIKPGPEMPARGCVASCVIAFFFHARLGEAVEMKSSLHTFWKPVSFLMVSAYVAFFFLWVVLLNSIGLSSEIGWWNLVCCRGLEDFILLWIDMPDS